MRFIRRAPFFLAVATLALVSPTLRAAETPSAPAVANPGDADFIAFKAIYAERAPARAAEMGAEKYYAWLDGLRLKGRAAGEAFLAKYPADPRRWDVVSQMTAVTPLFAKSWPADADKRGPSSAVIDETAKAQWETWAEAQRQALLASKDAAPSLREQLEWTAFAKDFRATSAAKAKGERYDYGVFRARFEAHVAKYADTDTAAKRAADYLGGLERNQPGSSLEIWQHLLTAPNAALREKAAERVQFFGTLSRPLELAFTAADGRTVDLAKLRGKVVLIDFWATWCGPCIAELPNIKNVYAAYHDKGFEIVGIALENGKLAPGDTPEQIAAKLEKAKKVMTDFTAKEAMPWPQYFDGKWWKNDISTRYAIKSIPAMFLLDQDGKVVSTNARGPTLEAEVKRLLKL